MTLKCIKKSCTNRAGYNYNNADRPIYCKEHKAIGMIPVGHPRCTEEGCEKYASYNYEGEKKPLYCATHPRLGMINITVKKCAEDECSLIPSFNYPTELAGMYCATHQLDGMINVMNRRKACINCTTSASFNFSGEKRPLYCGKHKLDNMVNIHRQICIEKDCDATATFRFEGTGKPIYCNTHKKEGMKKYKITCRKCDSTATFNFPGCKGSLYCSKHKLDGMGSNLKKCAHPGCVKCPSYGKFCSTHKPIGAKITKGSKCIVCAKIALYNFKNVKPPVCCSVHKEIGMILVGKHRCVYPGCETVVKFGFLGSPPIYCATHHIPGTIRAPTKRCTFNGCRELALFGVKERLFCEEHQRLGDRDFGQKKCNGCSLTTVVDETGHCSACNPSAWEVIRLAKQKEVQVLFDSSDFFYTSMDRQIEDGCGAERPDFLFECTTHCIVVEVDENQHKSRPCECEQTRMVNISQSLGMPTIFLRYNPDEYSVKRQRTDTLKSTRHRNLIKWVDKLLNLNPSEISAHGFLSVVYLYFDDFNPRKIQWETILQFEDDSQNISIPENCDHE